jgi:hypothetical protein
MFTMNELHEIIERWQSENRAWHLEGESGVKNLCRLVRCFGYKDYLNYGQFAHDGAYGDLIEFLNDNPGAIQAIIEWASSEDNEEWRESLLEHVGPDDEGDDIDQS